MLPTLLGSGDDACNSLAAVVLAAPLLTLILPLLLLPAAVGWPGLLLADRSRESMSSRMVAASSCSSSSGGDANVELGVGYSDCDSDRSLASAAILHEKV